MIYKTLSVVAIVFCLILPTLQILDQTYFKTLGISPS